MLKICEDWEVSGEISIESAGFKSLAAEAWRHSNQGKTACWTSCGQLWLWAIFFKMVYPKHDEKLT